MKRRKQKSLLDELFGLTKPARKNSVGSGRKGTSFPKATRGMTKSSGKSSMGSNQMKARNTWRNIT